MVSVVGGPAGWRGPEMAARSDWKIELTVPQQTELLEALALAPRRPLREVTKDDFPLPTLAALFADVTRELIDGRGFVLVRGVPIDGLAPDQIELLYWGIGQHVGRPIYQRRTDDLLVYVRDQGVDPNSPLVRGYQTSARLDYHCDSSDVVALLCVRPAASGGVSTIVSSVAVHDELVRRSPEVAALLHEQWWHDRKSGDGMDSFFQCSVFASRDGRLFAHYGRAYMESASRHPDIPPLPADRTAALDALDELTNSADFVLNMDFQPGDIQFLNNYTVMHARTEYIDHPEPSRKRELIRLWLVMDTNLGLPEDFAAAGIVSREVAFR
ncbi:MAG TPA: TauD/TfdA family dioxygenase [Jatrophihabitans sp.]